MYFWLWNLFCYLNGELWESLNSSTVQTAKESGFWLLSCCQLHMTVQTCHNWHELTHKAGFIVWSLNHHILIAPVPAFKGNVINSSRRSHTHTQTHSHKKYNPVDWRPNVKHRKNENDANVMKYMWSDQFLWIIYALSSGFIWTGTIETN